MNINWRILLSIGLLISYPWLFRGLLGGIHRYWHPDALTYVAHPLFDIARVTLAAVCAAIVSGVSAYIIVFMLQVRANFIVWLSVGIAAFVLYVLPFIEYYPAAFIAQLVHGGLGNLFMAFVVVCMPGILMFTAIQLANNRLQGDEAAPRA